MSKASKFIQLEQLSVLPEITNNKVKSLSNSPKNVFSPIQHFNLSPQPSSQVPNSLRQEDLLITQIRNKKDRKLTIKLSKRTQDTPVVTKKFNQLSKVLQDKDAYINQLESKIVELKTSTEEKLANLKENTLCIAIEDKVEEKIVKQIPIREKSVKSHSRDFEILNLRTENAQIKKILENISAEMSQQNVKLGDFEKIKKKNEELLMKLSQQELKIYSLEKNLKDRELEVTFKLEEINDINRMLKSSEDKRKQAIDQQKNIESKYIKLKSKYGSSKTTISEQKSSMEHLTKSLLLVERELKDLKFSYSEQASSLLACQSDLSLLNDEIQMLRDSKKSSTECLESKILKIEQENQGLKDSMQGAKAVSVRLNSKRSETVIHSTYFSRLASQELARTHHKLFELERKLIDKDLELEKVQNDCNYMKKKLQTKDNLVQKLEKMLQNDSESTEKYSLIQEYSVSVDIDELIDKGIKRIESTKNQIACSSCLGSNEFCVNFPCGHFTCVDCQQDGGEICVKCFKKVLNTAPARHCQIFLEFLEQEKKDLEQLKSLVFGSIKVNS